MKTMINRAAVMPRLFCLLFFFAGATSQAAPLTDLSGGQTGVIQFNSITTSIYGLVTTAPAPQITISGTLTFPDAVSGKMPAMILAHHCAGVTEAVTNQAAMLRTIGVATFVPDSFTPRGFPNGVCLGSTLSSTVTVADALFALKLLATHPNIDPNRIGIIGRGNVVHTTAHEEVRKSVITDQLKFAAYITLYPNSCNIRDWSPNMTRAPMLMLLGGADDWNPPGECLTFSVLQRSLGTPTTTIVYPDAPHGWDNTVQRINFNANRTVPGNCRFQFRLDTLQYSRYDTGELLDGTAATNYINSCLTKGASVGGHAATKLASNRDIATFLAKTFNLTGVATPASQPDRIFNYLENTYPTFIAPAGTASQTGHGYYFRYFSKTNSYIATRGGMLYYYAPDQNPNIVLLGPEESFLSQASQAGY